MSDALPRTCRLVLAVGLGAGLSAALAGCGPRDELLPVRGKVLLQDQPLPRGAVILTPDAAMGNATLHEPRGEIDAQGNYEISTNGKPGAPPGWYKVAVIALTAEIQRGSRRPPPPWLAPQRYAAPSTSGLAIEVTANAPPDGYDLRLKP